MKCLIVYFVCTTIFCSTTDEQIDLLFKKDTVEAVTFEDYESNISLRYTNFVNKFPCREIRALLSVRYFSQYPLPDNETEIILSELNNHLNELEKNNWSFYNYFLFNHVFFPKNDDKIFDFIYNIIINEENYIFNNARLLSIKYAIQFLGLVHTDKSFDFLNKATDRTYWEKFFDKRDIAFTDFIPQLQMAAFRGLLNMPLNRSIPAFERIIKVQQNNSDVRRVVMFCLDEAWRRKKGELPLDYEYRFEHENRTSLTQVTIPASIYWPEWMYGAGGNKIPYPFGKAPSGTEELKFNLQIPSQYAQ